MALSPIAATLSANSRLQANWSCSAEARIGAVGEDGVLSRVPSMSVVGEVGELGATLVPGGGGSGGSAASMAFLQSGGQPARRSRMTSKAASNAARNVLCVGCRVRVLECSERIEFSSIKRGIKRRTNGSRTTRRPLVCGTWWQKQGQHWVQLGTLTRLVRLHSPRAVISAPA